MTTNIDKIVKVADKFYRDLYSSWGNQHNNRGEKGTAEFGIPTVKTEEVKKAFEGMKSGKAAGEDQVPANLLRDAGHIVMEKFSTLHTQCPMTSCVQETWENANIT